MINYIRERDFSAGLRSVQDDAGGVIYTNLI